MANYRKSFNFRTGLQVDNDNFVVNANGLVGIGTSIPENYLLNVYGDTRITGVVTTGELNAGVGTVSTLTASNSTLGIAVVDSIQIVGGPVITDLVGYAYTTFITDAGGGISTTSRIGIGTISDTTDQLKVFGDTTFLGNIDISSGIVTASGFVGNITGDVTGNVTGTATTATNLADGANITTGTISNDRLPDLITSNINSSGVSTFTTLKLGSNIEMSGASGIITATSFSGPISGAVTGNADTATALETARDFSVSGDVATASAVSFDGTGNVDLAVTLSSSFNANTTGIITATGGFVGDVTGTATTATNLADGANITTGTISDDRLPDLITSNITGTATTATNLADGANITTGTISDDRLPDLITSNIDVSSGVSTVNELNVGTDGSALTALSTGNLGIGTTNPTQALQIIKDDIVSIEVVGSESRLILAEEKSGVSIASSASVIRYGNSDKNFELLNYASGNFNCYLHSGSAGINTGNFGWVYGQSNAEIMTLTYGGNLGINDTTPSQRLSVGGGVTVTGNAYIGGDLTVDGSLIGATLSLPDIVTSNINTLSGVSTFNDIIVQDVAQFSSIGIGTTNPISNIDARTSVALFGQIGINSEVPRGVLDVNGQSLFSSVGIGTTNTLGDGLVVSDVAVILQENVVKTYGTTLIMDSESSVGVGTTVPRCAVDLSEAGLNILSGAYRYMLPPRITTAERVGLTTVAGAFIFNTDTNKFQGYDGTTWQDFH